MNFASKKLAIVLQYIQLVLQMVLSLVYTPIMLRLLGQGEYGLYSLSGSVISYLSLLSLGLGASYIRFYSRFRAQNDEDGVRLLNGTYLLAFAFIALVALIGGMILAYYANAILNNGYSDSEIKLTRTLMIFMTVALSWSFLTSIFHSYIISQEKFVFHKLLSLLRTIIHPMMTLPLLFMGFGSIGLVATSLGLTIFFDLIAIRYCLKPLRMRFLFCNAGWQLLKEILDFSFIIAINGVVDQINWNVDKLILAKMLNKENVAIYSVANNISSLYLIFSVSISSVFTPLVHRIVQENKNNSQKQLTDVFIRVGRVQYLLLLLILSGFVFFGECFIYFWAGEGYKLSYWVILLLITPATLPLIQNVGIEIQRAENKHKFRMYVYLFMAFFNVVSSIFMCKYWGVIGCTLGTTVSVLIANGLIMNLYYNFEIGLDICRFWKEIGKITLAAIPVFLFGVLVIQKQIYSSFLSLILWIILYSAVYIIIIFSLGTNVEERMMILNSLKNHFPNIRKTKL